METAFWDLGFRGGFHQGPSRVYDSVAPRGLPRGWFSVALRLTLEFLKYWYS